MKNWPSTIALCWLLAGLPAAAAEKNALGAPVPRAGSTEPAARAGSIEPAESAVRLSTPASLVDAIDDHPVRHERFDHEVFQAQSLQDPGGINDLPMPNYDRQIKNRGERFQPFAFDTLFIARSGMTSPSTNVQMTELGFMYARQFQWRDNVKLTVRPFLDVLFLSGPGGGDPILPAQLYKVAIDLQFDYQLSDRWGFTHGSTPGLWTDFVSMAGRDWRIPSRTMLTYRVADGMFIAGGVLYTDNFRRNFLPAAGLVWNYGERIRIELLYPRSRIAYRVVESWEIYGIFERGGDTYNIRANGMSEMFEYRDNRLMLGFQGEIYDRFTIFAEFGAAFWRKFRLQRQLSPSIDPGFAMRAGIRF